MDLLVYSGARKLATERSLKTAEVILSQYDMEMRPSAGTIETVLHVLSLDSKTIRDSERPWALSPAPGPLPRTTPSGLRKDPVLGLLAGSSLTAAQNRALVNRTWSLLRDTDESYGSRFEYSEYQKASSFLDGIGMILRSHIMSAIMALAAIGPVKDILKKLSPEPGTGPSSTIEGSLTVKMEALARAEDSVRNGTKTAAHVEFSYAHGPYHLTALLLTQGAMSLLHHRKYGSGVYGCLTPAMLGSDRVGHG
ncbi:hypothetical protein Hte_008878 [Hypoxylon texense]